MEVNEFIKNFAAQFDETDAAVFKPETEFKKLEEWSSMLALSIIAMTDEEYEVQLKGDDIRSANTIQDLFDVINSKKN
jgi:acyl carrier protein